MCIDFVPKLQQRLGRCTDMPRAIWTGSISFGLVNVPVRMYSALDEHDLHFHLVHEPDDSRIGYQKICKKEDKPVPDDEIVKAYEFKKDEFVVLADEDFEAAKSEGVHVRSTSRTSSPTTRSTRSTSSAPISSGRRAAARRSTRSCGGRWRRRSSPRSGSS